MTLEEIRDATSEMEALIRRVYGVRRVNSLGSHLAAASNRMPGHLVTLIDSFREDRNRVSHVKGATASDPQALRRIAEEAIAILNGLNKARHEDPLPAPLMNAEFGAYLQFGTDGIDCSWSPEGHRHKWLLRQTGPDTVLIGSRHSGSVLDVDKEGGAWRIRTRPYNGGDNQRWHLAFEDAAYVIRSKVCGLVLDAHQPPAGLAVRLRVEDRLPNQRWWLHPALS